MGQATLYHYPGNKSFLPLTSRFSKLPATRSESNRKKKESRSGFIPCPRCKLNATLDKSLEFLICHKPYAKQVLFQQGVVEKKPKSWRFCLAVSWEITYSDIQKNGRLLHFVVLHFLTEVFQIPQPTHTPAPNSGPLSSQLRPAVRYHLRAGDVRLLLWWDDDQHHLHRENWLKNPWKY